MAYESHQKAFKAQQAGLFKGIFYIIQNKLFQLQQAIKINKENLLK